MRIDVAETWRARLRGLAFTDRSQAPEALLFPGTRSVHTVGMRFAVDLVWLDDAGRIVRVDCGVAPNRHRWCRAARAVIETPAGASDRLIAAIFGRVDRPASHTAERLTRRRQS
jgi:uncharacterized membrane protein (UPF0127 family)